MIFIDLEVVLALHDRQIADHGGLAGIRDAGLLEAALARPQHREAYGIEDIHEIAAAYAYGIARNHPFLDGNKRTALHVALLFLALNGGSLPAPSPEMVERMVALAEGSLSEAAFADWLRGDTLHEPQSSYSR